MPNMVPTTLQVVPLSLPFSPGEYYDLHSSPLFLISTYENKVFARTILSVTSRGNLSMFISIGLFPHLLNGARIIPVVSVEITFT